MSDGDSQELIGMILIPLLYLSSFPFSFLPFLSYSPLLPFFPSKCILHSLNAYCIGTWIACPLCLLRPIRTTKFTCRKVGYQVGSGSVLPPTGDLEGLICGLGLGGILEEVSWRYWLLPSPGVGLRPGGV